jgi:hypothetical protein
MSFLCRTLDNFELNIIRSRNNDENENEKKMKKEKTDRDEID